MLASLRGRWIVLLIALCVLLLFFFPLMQGPFQATHGPTTAFRARVAFLVLILSIILSSPAILDQLSKLTVALTSRNILTRNPIASDGMAIPECIALRC